NIKIDYLEEYIEARRRAAHFYNEAFKNIPGLQVPTETAYSKHTFHQYTLRIKDGRRDELHQYLAEKEIPSMIYYPIPAHQQKMFEGVKGLPETLPVTDQLTQE